jgi:menaquinone-dependent protoporphyrinogen oxidase
MLNADYTPQVTKEIHHGQETDSDRLRHSRWQYEEVAQSIAESLIEHGAGVDVQPVEAIATLTTFESYSAVFLGSAIRAGHWLPEAVKFVKHHKADLEKLPIVYFLVCATMREDTPKHHYEVLAYLKPVRAIVEPLEMGLFAGKLDTAKLGFFAKLVVKAMRSEQGDWRDWEAIHDWAGKIYAQLEHNDVAP